MLRHTNLLGSVLGKAALATVALSGFLFLGSPNARAADREDHGYFSRQSEHSRHEYREAYEDGRGYYRDDAYRRNEYRNYDYRGNGYRNYDKYYQRHDPERRRAWDRDR